MIHKDNNENISYQNAVEEIERILHAIESEELDVDHLSEKVKRVSQLLTICKMKLRKTEDEVEEVLKKLE